MKLSIIIIGDEILLGRVTDTNSGTISRTLEPEGFKTVTVRTVGDNYASIRGAVESALEEADLVITTGGLGPTRDDITRSVLMEIFGGELYRNDAVTENIHNIFRDRNLKLNTLTLDQALVPTSCEVIQNLYGTAPIMVFHREGKLLICMPGVPAETRGMIGSGVLGYIHAHYRTELIARHSEITVTGISESALAEQLRDYELSLPEGIKLAYLPYPGRIILRLDGEGIEKERFTELTEGLISACGQYFQGKGALSPAEIVLNKCHARGLTLACAESCTGGRISAALTAIPGSSDVFMGGVVSYSNYVKIHTLGVLTSDLELHGAVSEEVVLQMAAGVRGVTGADCACSSSGIAGPGGGSPEKPVGTVWIAASVKDKSVSQLLHLKGAREDIASAAAERALLLLSSIL